MQPFAAFLAGLTRIFHLQSEGRDERGATAVEYALMVGLIALVIIGAVTLLGGNLSTMFSNIATQV